MSNLDPQVAAILETLAQLKLPDLSEQTPAQARAGMKARPLPSGPEMPAEDHTPAGLVPIRIYRPRDSADLPCLVWLHGGGFVLGDLDSHDAVCRQIAADSGWAVASVDYRLAPEHPFPAALEDAVASLRWLARQGGALGIDATRLAVGGDSAGGNLATVAAGLLAGQVPLALQVLVYPVTDLRSLDRESYRVYGEGHYLTTSGMAWFRDHYLAAGARADDPRVSPLAGSPTDGLPEALIITAECDVLRDEGEAYARALEAAGVPTTLTRYPGVIHAFVSLYPFVDRGREAIQQIATALRACGM